MNGSSLQQNPINGVVAKFEKNTKSQRALPIQQSPQKYGSLNNSTTALNQTMPSSGQMLRQGHAQMGHSNSRNNHAMVLTTGAASQSHQNLTNHMQLGQQEKFQNLHKHIQDKLSSKQDPSNISPQADQERQKEVQNVKHSKTNQSKIEQKNRMINDSYAKTNKNLTDAQKRIAKIIREQQNNPNQMPANEQTMNPNEQNFTQAMKKRPSQNKSRNQAIPMSKSENIIGANNQKFVNNSPKTILAAQQKKMVEHNSNANFQTASSSTLRNTNQLNTTNTSEQNVSSSHQGVNRLRASSGMRNKPGQSSQNSQQTLYQSSQNQRGQQPRDKSSRSQPPASNIKQIEKQPAQTKKIQQSKSQNSLVNYRGFVMTVQQQQEYMKMEQEQIDRYVSSYHPAKFACKKNGVVSSYSANTHQGIVRNYNEDRVSIILNIIKPKFKNVEEWPRCSFFAVYDGHGGAACADYLRDQLHQLIVRDENFPQNPRVAIENGIAEAERIFLEWAHQQSKPEEDFVERSGTCAIIVLIVGDVCYVANVGDSRAIMSVDGGEKILLLSKDHKPEDDVETKRVEENGGQIYQNKSYVPDPSPDNASGVQMIIGPHRVFPGRLSVSRTIGDIEAKDVRYGGNPKCVIPTPDIKCFKIRNNYDFIVLGCDGIFEKQDNKQIINAAWEASRADFQNDDVIRRNIDPNIIKQGPGGPVSIHQKAGLAVDKMLHECVLAKTLDNITSVMIAFDNFEVICGGDKKDEAQQKYDILMQQRRSLEPVQEEFLESELDTPNEPIQVVRSKPVSRKEQNRSPKVAKSLEKKGSGLLSQTQPVNINASAQYNTISAGQNLSQTQMVNQARVSSATKTRSTVNLKPKTEYQTIQYSIPQIGAKKEVPSRGQSGSARRKIVAQQSMQHMKKQMGKDAKDTPKTRNTNIHQYSTQQPQMGQISSNRIKSSRASQTRGQPPFNGSQPRAITPKQNQKMYQSINVSKDPRNSSNKGNRMNADYMLKNSMGKGQIQQIGNLMSNKSIPKKDFRESGNNFNSTHAIKTTHQGVTDDNNFQSTGNLKMKTGLGGLNNMAKPNNFTNDPSGRYKKKH